MPAKEFFFALLSKYGFPWLLVSLAGIIIFILCAVVIEPLWMVGSLIWICLIIPNMMLFLYIFHGLKKTNVFNISRHILEFHEDLIRIIVFRKEEDKEQKKSLNSDEPGTNYAFTLSYNNFSGLHLRKKGIIFRFKGENEGFIYLPIDAFGEEKFFHKQVEQILSYMHKDLILEVK